MSAEQISEARNNIAKLGGYELITDFPPHIWSNGKKRILNISFDKPKSYLVLLEIVEKIEQEKDLIIEIKRNQCSISKMHLTRNQKFIDVDGETSKQKAIFQALAKLGCVNE